MPRRVRRSAGFRSFAIGLVGNNSVATTLPGFSRRFRSSTGFNRSRSDSPYTKAPSGSHSRLLTGLFSCLNSSLTQFSRSYRSIPLHHLAKQPLHDSTLTRSIAQLTGEPKLLTHLLNMLRSGQILQHNLSRIRLVSIVRQTKSILTRNLLRKSNIFHKKSSREL
jgi:hypothetical protein